MDKVTDFCGIKAHMNFCVISLCVSLILARHNFQHLEPPEGGVPKLRHLILYKTTNSIHNTYKMITHRRYKPDNI